MSQGSRKDWSYDMGTDGNWANQAGFRLWQPSGGRAVFHKDDLQREPPGSMQFHPISRHQTFHLAASETRWIILIIHECIFHWGPPAAPEAMSWSGTKRKRLKLSVARLGSEWRGPTATLPAPPGPPEPHPPAVPRQAWTSASGTKTGGRKTTISESAPWNSRWRLSRMVGVAEHRQLMPTSYLLSVGMGWPTLRLCQSLWHSWYIVDIVWQNFLKSFATTSSQRDLGGHLGEFQWQHGEKWWVVWPCANHASSYPIFLHVKGLELDRIKLQARPFGRSTSSTLGVLLVTHCCEARWHCWSKAARLGGSAATAAW